MTQVFTFWRSSCHVNTKLPCLSLSMLPNKCLTEFFFLLSISHFSLSSASMFFPLDNPLAAAQTMCRDHQRRSPQKAKEACAKERRGPERETRRWKPKERPDCCHQVSLFALFPWLSPSTPLLISLYQVPSLFVLLSLNVQHYHQPKSSCLNVFDPGSVEVRVRLLQFIFVSTDLFPSPFQHIYWQHTLCWPIHCLVIFCI